MTEWIVCGVVVAVIGAGWKIVQSVSNVVSPLTAQITKLNMSMQSITGDLTELTDRNSKTHARLFDQIEKLDDRVQNHETRLALIEDHERKNAKGA